MSDDQRNHIFISYSHKDSRWLEILRTHLKPLVRLGRIYAWDDTTIVPGSDWKKEISTAIAKAKVALLLVSPDFLASDFILENELPPLLEAAEKNGVVIFWVAVRESSYKKTAIERYQAANDPLKPLAALKAADRDCEMVKICEKLEAVTSQYQPLKLSRLSSDAPNNQSENKKYQKDEAGNGINPISLATNTRTRVEGSKSMWRHSLRLQRNEVMVILWFLLIVFGTVIYLTLKNAGTAIDSIAILPFENNDTDTAYLSDGMTDTLITSFLAIPNLRVIPTTSVMRYKGKEIDMHKIGAELGVKVIMTGRITKYGSHLTVRIEFDDVKSNKVIGISQYERTMPEFLRTRNDIATEIAHQLRLRLSRDDQVALTKRFTDNNEAFRLYLEARSHFANRTRDDIQSAIHDFQLAIDFDKTFALAYVGLADCYNIGPSYGYSPPKDSIPRAREAARQALVINESLPEAHAALAAALAEYDWSWPAAEQEFRRALELQPRVADVHYRYGLNYLLPMGHMEDAINQIEQAVALEPDARAINANLAAMYMYSRQYSRALDQAQKTYTDYPSFITGRIWLGYIYNVMGKYQEALALIEQPLRADPTSQPFLRIAGYAYAKTGHRRQAEGIIKKLNIIGKQQYISHYRIATIYAALGEHDKACNELKNAWNERDWSLPFLNVDPLMDPIRDDRCLIDIAQQIRLPR